MNRATVALPYLLSLALLLAATVFAQLRPAPVVPLVGDWEYRWEDGRDAGWRPIDFPSNPPGREGAGRLTVRHALPARLPPSPVLFIYSIDIAATVSVDGREVYRWNVPAPGAEPEFRGWPWHAITLPPEAAGGVLSIEIISDYRDIGLWGRAFLGSPAAVFEYLVRRDLPYLSVVFLAIAVTIVMIGTAQGRDYRRETLLLLATLLSLAITTFADTHVRQFLIPNALVWHLVSLNGHAATVGFGALLVARLIRGAVARMIRTVGVVAFIGMAVGNLLLLSGTSGPAPFFLFNDAISIVAAVGVVAALLAGGLPRDDRLVLIGSFGVLAALVVVNVLVAWSILPWIDSLTALMLFQLIAAVLYIFFRRYRLTQIRLQEADSTLARVVDERTSELRRTNQQLSAEKRRLEERAVRDPLTGMFNRDFVLRELEERLATIHERSSPLSVGMFDLDHFKEVNDTHGHLVGDDVLRETARLLSEHTRDTEIVGRYGGEEFLVLFDDCPLAQAQEIATRLIEAIREHPFPIGIRLTLSGGVSEYRGGTVEQLVQRADEALYLAKERGRNRLESWPMVEETL